MSQPQPSSLPHWRMRSVEVGCHQALRECSEAVDRLNDALGRRQDLLSTLRFTTFVAGIALGVFICWGTACATMIHDEPAADWPKLEVVMHRVSLVEVVRRCHKYLTPLGKAMALGIPGGCAEINFAAVRCDIWLPEGENDSGFEEHERAHCDGKDHPGDTTLRDAWRTYRGTR